jgi:hypothetical protein
MFLLWSISGCNRATIQSTSTSFVETKASWHTGSVVAIVLRGGNIFMNILAIRPTPLFILMDDKSSGMKAIFMKDSCQCKICANY